jgi:hypothetical protein
MYTREIQPPRNSPVEDGRPLQGTWDRAFDEVDLLDIHRPYLFPLPRRLRDFRIKEWESLHIQDEKVFLGFLLANFKSFRMAQAFLYDKEKNEKFLVRKLLPFGGWSPNSWRLPKSLANSSAFSGSRRFFFRIHSWLDTGTVKFDLNIESSGRKPALTAHIEYNMGKGPSPMAVSLGFSGRRSMYAFKAMAPVQGDIVLGGRRIIMESGLGFFCDYKGFFPYRMRETLCSALDFSGRFGFHLGENQARETYRNNENALWTDERLSPLPPVRITMPRGVDSDWIIQDVEGMVDLVFSPKEPNQTRVNSFFSSADYSAPLGHYNGMLAAANGEQIQVRNVWGMGESFHLRV